MMLQVIRAVLEADKRVYAISGGLCFNTWLFHTLQMALIFKTQQGVFSRIFEREESAICITINEKSSKNSTEATLKTHLFSIERALQAPFAKPWLLSSNSHPTWPMAAMRCQNWFPWGSSSQMRSFAGWLFGKCHVSQIPIQSLIRKKKWNYLENEGVCIDFIQGWQWNFF